MDEINMDLLAEEEIDITAELIEDFLKGDNGITPTIGANGNWYLGETDTGKPSRGEQGERGEKGDKRRHRR